MLWKIYSAVQFVNPLVRHRYLSHIYLANEAELHPHLGQTAWRAVLSTSDFNNGRGNSSKQLLKQWSRDENHPKTKLSTGEWLSCGQVMQNCW